MSGPVAFEENSVTILCSPAYLRALAEKMERKYANASVGDSTVVDLIHVRNTGLTVHIGYDQQYFLDQERNAKPRNTKPKRSK